MRLLTKLHVFFVIMLALSLSGAVLSIWSARQANFQIERMNLAHDSYETHLALSSHTYQLFKQYGDALIIGDHDNGAGERELIRNIRADVARIRRIIGLEIDLVGEEEIEELQALAEIENKIEDLISALERILELPSPSEFSATWAQLSQILDDEIDRDFRAMIEAALQEEAREVEETRAEAQQHLILYQIIAGIFSVIAMLIALTSLWTMRKQFSEPVQQLIEGVRSFSDGDMDRRVGLKGHDELSEIGAIFDMMAERVVEKTQTLAAQNIALERAVTERTQQLERLLEEAKSAEGNRRRMLTDVSHELRTPLTVIRGEADIALRGEDKSLDDYREALIRSRDAAVHTSRLVDDLLFVARNETGRARLVFEEVDLLAVVNDLSHNLGQDVPIVTDLTEAALRGDAGRLRQAILVLLDNARLHGGTETIIRLDQTPDGFRVAVEDNGAGMSDADKESAFVRFFRGSNAAERYREGLGLGLPIALSIAQAHGGSITLEDRPGGGLIGSIFLPRYPKLRTVA
ncbi:MAG: HAMP domain-containing sensor histidine kinase [Pseudomonadota bacterium]